MVCHVRAHPLHLRETKSARPINSGGCSVLGQNRVHLQCVKARSKRIWVGSALAVCVFLITAFLWPDKVAALTVAASDTADIEPVTVPAIDQPLSPRPTALKFQGAQLKRVRALLDIRDGHGAICMCSGEYKLRFSRWGVPLASFTGHLQETPARLMGSFAIITLDSHKAHLLFSLLRHSPSSQKASSH